MPLEGQPLLLTISTLTALSFCLIGYDNGGQCPSLLPPSYAHWYAAVIGGLTNAPSWNAAFNYPTGDALSTIVAIYEVGCFFGAVACAIGGEAMGRKKCLSLGSAIMAVGAILQASVRRSNAKDGVRLTRGMQSFSRAQIIVARIVSGLGMGELQDVTVPRKATYLIRFTQASSILPPRFCKPRSRPRRHEDDVRPHADHTDCSRLLITGISTDVCAQLSTLNFGIFLSYWIDCALSSDPKRAEA